MAGQPGRWSRVRPIARTRPSRTASRVPAMRRPRGRARGPAPPGPRGPRNGRPRCGGPGSGRAAGRCRRSRQAHLVRPVTPKESRGCLDVAGAGRPGGVVRGVVLGPERFQPHFPGREPAGSGEIGRDEQLITHQAMLAAPPAAAEAPPQVTSQATEASGQPPSPPMAAVMFRETYGATQFRRSARLAGSRRSPVQARGGGGSGVGNRLSAGAVKAGMAGWRRRAGWR
jgi:hypothetical protein